MQILPKHSEGRNKRAGFTIIELLVVLGIVSLCIGLLMAAVIEIRNAALRSECQNKMKNIALALSNCHAQHGRFPPFGDGSRGEKSDPHFYLTWLVQTLPYLEQESVWLEADSACKLNPLALTNPPHVGIAKVIPQYVCPAEPEILSPLINSRGETKGYSSYLSISSAISSPLGKNGGERLRAIMKTVGPGTRISEILDGTSSTLLLGERPVPDSLQAGHWYSKVPEGFGPTFNGILDTPPLSDFLDPPCQGYPQEYGPGRKANPCDRDHFWSLHRGGANFAMVDGSVRLIPYSAKYILPSLATIAGGEVIPDF